VGEIETAGDAAGALGTGTTFLFVPGDRADRFEKAVGAAADVVILDLEDAVDRANKQSAREAVAAWLGGKGRACVRVNAAGTADFERDLAALEGLPGLLGVMLPKADSASASAAASSCGAPVVALVESAVGVADAPRIAATTGVLRLAFGHLDYAVDIGASPSRTSMLYARSALVQASRIAALPGPIDGITTSLDEPDVLRDDCRHAQEIGMTGKLLIHPIQIAPTRAAYLPDADAVRWARRVLEAPVGSATRVDGHMVDAPVLARAAAILRRVG